MYMSAFTGVRLHPEPSRMYLLLKLSIPCPDVGSTRGITLNCTRTLHPRWHMSYVLYGQDHELCYYFAFFLIAAFVELSEVSRLAFFMIVSFPEEAAATICCSMELLILALSFLCIAACCTAWIFFGGACLLPFFVFAAALAECLAADPDAFCAKPLVFP